MYFVFHLGKDFKMKSKPVTDTDSRICMQYSSVILSMYMSYNFITGYIYLGN
jgi:hypothetical protein